MKTGKSILMIALLFISLGISESMAQNEQAKLIVSKEVNKSADAVWTLLRKMDDLEKYSSVIATTEWTGVKGIGGLRVCKTADGQGFFKERIVGFDDANRSYSYSLLEGAPVKGLINTYKVVDLGYNKSKVVWWSNYEAFLKNPQMTEDQFIAFMKQGATEFTNRLTDAAKKSSM